MRSARSSLDLVATLALALLALLAALLPVEPWMRATVLIPFVFASPGYAVVSAMLPSNTIPPAERTVYTVALSIAISVLCGVIVQEVVGLDRAIWAIVLTLVTGTASVAALRRRGALPWSEQPRPAMPTLRRTAVLMLAVAVGLAAWAISIASAGDRKGRVDSPFTDLWVLPAKMPPPGGDAVSIGVDAHQGVPVSYQLRVTQNGIVLADRPLRLRDNQRWHAQFPVPAITGTDPIQVTLLREGALYRRAYLESGLGP